MMIDGEWRVAFIAGEHPELDYGTAPLPVDDAHPELYGAGYVNGTIIGIPKGVKHKEQAWALLKYLTTNDYALAHLSNGLRNVPTTKASLAIAGDQAGRALQDVPEDLRDPKSKTSPITAAGDAYGPVQASQSSGRPATRVTSRAG